MSWKVCLWTAFLAATILGPLSVQLAGRTGETIPVYKAQANHVYVAGAVRRPGGYVLQAGEKMTVLRALSLAGGLTATAHPGSALVFRRTASGSRHRIPAALNKMLKGKVTNLELIGGDILYVPSVGERGDLIGPLNPIPMLSLGRSPTSAKGTLEPQDPSRDGMCNHSLRP